MKKQTFPALLNKIENKEFQEFVLYYSQNNKRFKDDFELYFAEKNTSFDIEKKYSEVIKNTIKKHTSRGFIDYSASNKLGKEIEQFISTAKQYFSKKNYKDAMALYQIIIKEVSPVFGYCDDSNGYVSGCVEIAISELSEFLNVPVSFAFKEKITDFLKVEVQKRIYYDYGNFGIDLAEIYQLYCIATSRIEEFSRFLDKKIQAAKNDDYDQRFFIETKIKFLGQIGKVDQVANLIQENLQIPEIRKIEVKNKINNKEYDLAKTLIVEGIKIAEEKRHAGTVFDFEKLLLEIAVLEKDVKFERFYCRKFALGRSFNAKYYEQWKNTFSKEERIKIIEELISGIKNSTEQAIQKNMFYNPDSLNYNLLYHLGPIYIQEDFHQDLLELVQKQATLSTILEYYSYLIKKHPQELIDLILPLLLKEGEYAQGRSQYKELARKIKRLIKDYPNDKNRILEVTQKLKDKFPRRPAMLDELGKLF